MTTQFADPAEPPGPGTVDADTPCRKCQYNLRGLSTEGRCPECGSAVGLSLRGDLIRYSDPQWVETLRRGILFILWAVVLAIVAAVITANRAQLGVFPGQFVSLIAYFVNFGGGWFLTTPDPSGLGEESYGRSRKVIRFTLLAGAVQKMVDMGYQNLSTPGPVELAYWIANTLLAIVSLVGTFATLRYLSKLAERIPNDSLARKAGNIMWGLGIPLALFALLVPITAFVRKVPGAPGRGAFANPLVALGCASGIGGLVMVIYGIRYLLLLERLGKEFKVQSIAARESWASAPVSPGGAKSPGGIPDHPGGMPPG